MPDGPDDTFQQRLAARQAIERAAGTAALLGALGRRLDFVPDAGDGVVAHLCDREGVVISRMTAPQVIRLVDGLAGS